MRTKPSTDIYIAYYRVSTDKQGERGLGIQAQRDAIDRFLNVRNNANLHACFTEVESGTRKGNDRPGLRQALALTQQLNATLLIAKLDRLTRDPDFLGMLMKAGTDFVACDMPDANRLTIRIMAAFAEHEADCISKRTSAAIQAKISRGAQWGFSLPSRVQFVEAKKQAADEFAANMQQRLTFYLQNHYSLNRIAKELNRLQVATASGLVGSWTARSVKNCLERCAA